MNRRKFLLTAFGAPVAAATVTTTPAFIARVRASQAHFIFQTMLDPAVRALHLLAGKDEKSRRAQLIIHSAKYTNYTDRFGKSDRVGDGNILWTQVTTAPPFEYGPAYSVSCWSVNDKSTIRTHSVMGKLVSFFALDHATGNTIHRKFKNA